LLKEYFSGMLAPSTEKICPQSIGTESGRLISEGKP
jgi:hypothetical protein